MTINQNLKFTEEYLPPRCRKHRTRIADDTFTGIIPEVTAADAPLAFRIHGTSAAGTKRQTDIRQYDDKFYVPETNWTGNKEQMGERYHCKVNELNAIVSRLLAAGVYKSKSAAKAHFMDVINEFLIIDGMVWGRTYEPCYLVHGTMISICTEEIDLDKFEENVFSAFQEKEAWETVFAARKAKDIKVPDDWTEGKPFWIEVVDPSAVKLHRGPAIFVIEKAIVKRIAIKAECYEDAMVLAKSLLPHAGTGEEVHCKFCGIAQESEPHLITDDKLA